MKQTAPVTRIRQVRVTVQARLETANVQLGVAPPHAWEGRIAGPRRQRAFVMAGIAPPRLRPSCFCRESTGINFHLGRDAIGWDTDLYVSVKLYLICFALVESRAALSPEAICGRDSEPAGLFH
jgi:hypothetical protein